MEAIENRPEQIIVPNIPLVIAQNPEENKLNPSDNTLTKSEVSDC